MQSCRPDYLELLNYYLTLAMQFYLCCVVVVHHITIVAIGHGLFKKFWLSLIGCVLRTTGSFPYLKLHNYHITDLDTLMRSEKIVCRIYHKKSKYLVLFKRFL